MSANQPTAAWSGPGDPLVVVAGHLVSPQDGFGEIGRMPNGNLRRPRRLTLSESLGVGAGTLAFSPPDAGAFFESTGPNAVIVDISARDVITSGQIGTRSSHNLRIISNNMHRWTVQTAGHFVAGSDDMFDIGGSGSKRPRDIFIARNLEIGGSLNHDGTTVGLYGTIPIAQQTGVAVTSAGIHAACVALGLFTA